MGQIFNISASLPFLSSLARGVLQRFDEPHKLTIFLPSKRAIRVFTEEFWKASGKPAVLLPKLQAIGDVEEEELEINFADLPPEIAPHQRLYRLARLINGPSFANDLSLAASYISLVDEVQNAGLTLDALRQVTLPNYAEHWQKTVDFLSNIAAPWEEYLATNNLLEPINRRSQILQRIAQNLGDGPVLIAGSTGTIKATAELIKAIYARANGHVVLQGLDDFLTADDFAALEETHPQKALSNLLKKLGIKKDAVEVWQATEQTERQKLLHFAMLPSFKTDSWQGAKLGSKGLQLLETKNTEEEALNIAIALRGALEAGKTAFVVTSSRDLARKISAKLKIWDVEINDSALTPYLATPDAAFVLQLAEVLVQHQAPVPLMAFLKHQFMSADIKQKARAIEKEFLHAPRIDGFKIQHHGINFDGFDELQAMFEKRSVPLKKIYNQLVSVASKIAPELEVLALEFDDNHHVDPLQLPDILRQFFALTKQPPKWVLNHNINIFSPIEARLQTADLVIVSSLNEGSLPHLPVADSFLSQSIRREMGLDLLHKKIGQQAHDFELLLAAPSVLLTRSVKDGGAAQIKSRFLERLQAVTQLEPAPNYGQQFYNNLPSATLPRPAPKPPAGARPTQIYATTLGKLMRDPYVFYAKEILQLKKLDDLDEDITAADFGNFVHNVLEEYAKTHADIFEIGKNQFEAFKHHVGATSFWWPRFIKIATEFLALERKVKAEVEIKGEYKLGNFTFKAKADRVEVTDKIRIIDFKTGAVPSKQNIEKGLEPQLTLEAIIFEQMFGKQVEALEYWHLKDGIEIKQVPLEVIAITREALPNIVRKITDANTAFLVRPWSYYALQYNDYEHLERIKEWDS
jgi:ATP-dependent helicase/nuclease subunit B